MLNQSPVVLIVAFSFLALSSSGMLEASGKSNKMREDQLQSSRDAYMLEMPRLISRSFAVPLSYRDGAAVVKFELTGAKAKNIKLVSSKGTQDYADKAILAVETCQFRESPFQTGTVYECRFNTNEVTVKVD